MTSVAIKGVHIVCNVGLSRGVERCRELLGSKGKEVSRGRGGENEIMWVKKAKGCSWVGCAVGKQSVT